MLVATRSASLYLLANQAQTTSAQRAALIKAVQHDPFVASFLAPSRAHPLAPLFRRWAARGASLRSVALVVGMSKSSLHRAVVALRASLARDAVNPSQASPACGNGRRQRVPRVAPKLSPPVLAALRGMALSNYACTWTNRQFRDRLLVRFPHLGSLSVSAVAYGLNITRKKPTRISFAAMKLAKVRERRCFATKFFRRVNLDAIGKVQLEAEMMRRWQPVLDPRLLFFTDESGFKLDTANRALACSVRGTPAPVVQQYVRGRNQSLIMVAGFTDGIVASELRTGRYDTDKFLAFLENSFCPYVRTYRRTLPASLRSQPIRLVLDNAPIHKSKRVVETLASANIVATYLPPYTPVLNPCENIFANIKTRLRTTSYLETEPNGLMSRKVERLRLRVQRALQGVTHTTVRGFFRLCAWGRYDKPSFRE